MVSCLVVQLQIFLSVVSYRIAKALNKSRATRLIGRYISKAFDRVWQVGLTQVEWNFSFLALFCHFSAIDGFWMVNRSKNILFSFSCKLHSQSFSFPSIHQLLS